MPANYYASTNLTCSKRCPISKPIPNDPTKEQYIPPEKQGKRGKYDPGPVFGTSINFYEQNLRYKYFLTNNRVMLGRGSRYG
ncbi:MAG: hypothetical protein CM15mP49_14020 [Actinomycetota bacterium]|nr:MAG: hypothetical protein CM15mP49_14020 [Actinomycetota bacterium]